MRNEKIVKAFNRVEPSEADKRRMLGNIQRMKALEGLTAGKTGIGKKILFPITACILLTIVLSTILLGRENYILDDGRKAVSENPAITESVSKFSGFILTAYAAENEDSEIGADYKDTTAATVLTPEVSVMLPRYNLFMSSVPGLPFTFNFNNKDNASDKTYSISVAVDFGQLLTWDIASGKITEKGTVTVCQAGDTLYWTPLSDDDGASQNMSDSTGKEIHITVTAMKNSEKLGSQTIVITEKEHNYSATAKQLEKN